MARFSSLEPEAPGEWGDRTDADLAARPPSIVRVHIELERRITDDLVQLYPCFMVSARLADELGRTPLSGYQLAELEVSAAPRYRAAYPDEPLPELAWFKVFGRAGYADFGLSYDGHLVVSKAALLVLKKFSLVRAGKTKYERDAGGWES
jgi:hypothetical protein